MIQTQAFPINDFSGGFTDQDVGVQANKCKTCDNLLITPDMQLMSRGGSVIEDESQPQIPTASRISTLINYNNNTNLLVQSARNVYFRNPSAYTTIQGPSGNPVFSVGDALSRVSHAQWNKHLFITHDGMPNPMKLYKDGSTFYARTAGLPLLASSPVVTPVAGAANYIYAFIYYYTYTIDGVVYEDFGGVTYVSALLASPPNVNPIAISAIPVLANGATGNYDTANIKVKIYRTTDNGGTLFYVGEVTNGTTVYNDITSDAVIELNEFLYTTGDIVENSPPPKCKYLTIVNGIAWYAHVEEAGETLNFRVRQSLQDDPDSVPDTFYTDLEDEITGISHINNTPIVFCKKNIYRLDGLFDELGSGGVFPQRISDIAGCLSNSSIVKTERGLFFFGNDGVYFTDGFSVDKINDDWNDTYKTITETAAQKRNITGVYDRDNNRVWWANQYDQSSGDNDKCYILDLRWGVTRQSTFTTVSGGESFRPSAIVFYNGLLYRGDVFGYMFKHLETEFNDPKIDQSVVASLWHRQAIIWDYKTINNSFGTAAVRKWVTKILLTAKNKSNLSIQIVSNNDDNRKISNLVPIEFRGNITWGDPDIIWGDPDLIWNYDGIIEVKRRFPAKGIRCGYKSVQVTNASVIVSKSDTIGTASVDSTAKTVTLTNIAQSDWPADCEEMFISFENDNYGTQFLIDERTDDTLTVEDAANQLIDGTYKWVITGVPKNEKLHLVSLIIAYAMASETHDSYHGENVGNE